MDDPYPHHRIRVERLNARRFQVNSNPIKTASSFKKFRLTQDRFIACYISN